MNALTKGWCPSLYEPMLAGDGFLVRVKPRVAGISAAQLRVVAKAAAEYGSGRIEITNRANLQIRGLTVAAAHRFAETMRDAGLASADPAAERRRNIAVEISDDPALLTIAQQLEDWLEQDAALSELPAKFGFYVGNGAGHADINLRPAPSIALLPGSGLAASGALLPAAQALTHAFLRLAKILTPPPSRMSALIKTVGAAKIFAEAGLATTACEPPAAAPQQAGLFPPFGAMDAAMLGHGADLAARFGNGWVKPTTERSLVLLNSNAAAWQAEAARYGFITDPADPRLRIAACAGTACPNGLADVRQIAAHLAPSWTGTGILHVSGCAKGCAHPRAAAMTLIARETNFDVVLNGSTASLPTRSGITVPALIQMLKQQSLNHE